MNSLKQTGGVWFFPCQCKFSYSEFYASEVLVGDLPLTTRTVLWHCSCYWRSGRVATVNLFFIVTTRQFYLEMSLGINIHKIPEWVLKNRENGIFLLKWVPEQFEKPGRLWCKGQNIVSHLFDCFCTRGCHLGNLRTNVNTSSQSVSLFPAFTSWSDCFYDKLTLTCCWDIKKGY